MDTIDGRWRFCTLISFIGVVFLVFFLERRHDTAEFSTFPNVNVSETIIKDSMELSIFAVKTPPTMQTASSSLNVSDERRKKINDGNRCDVFDGKWVYDLKGSPLYSTAQCPFLSDQVSCQRNGRPDMEYEKWSWEGNRCKVPRFNGMDMLERLRGKRVVIVGDSLNRNQWESLACLLYSSIPSSDAIVDSRKGDHKVFRSKSYNCSVEFFWSPFLVQMEVQMDQRQAKNEKVLRLDRLPDSARRWRGANVMIFNTGHWWVHQGKFKRWDLFEYQKVRTRTMPIDLAYERAMSTWAKWIDRHINPTDTTVFFRSISPEHKGKNFCFNITQPTFDMSYKSTFPKRISEIAQRTIDNMKTPVTYLNITSLSGYRRDAHPMVYTVKQGKLLTEEQRKKPEIYADCSHWCLPGLPDTWNRLIYASMVMDDHGSSSSRLLS